MGKEKTTRRGTIKKIITRAKVLRVKYQEKDNPEEDDQKKQQWG